MGASKTAVKTGAAAQRLTREVHRLSVSMSTLQSLARYHAPTTVVKYNGETNTSVWLQDYRLACYNGGATNDLFIIKSIPSYLADWTRTWIKHLP